MLLFLYFYNNKVIKPEWLQKTLKNAMVTGPYEYVAILIFKKAEAQINAKKLTKGNL